MYNSSNTVKVDLPSTCSIIGIIFICCKLFGVINWSWWLVLLPFWGPVALALAIIIVAVIACALLDKDD